MPDSSLRELEPRRVTTVRDVREFRRSIRRNGLIVTLIVIPLGIAVAVVGLQFVPLNQEAPTSNTTTHVGTTNASLGTSSGTPANRSATVNTPPVNNSSNSAVAAKTAWLKKLKQAKEALRRWENTADSFVTDRDADAEWWCAELDKLRQSAPTINDLTRADLTELETTWGQWITLAAWPYLMRIREKLQILRERHAYAESFELLDRILRGKSEEDLPKRFVVESDVLRVLREERTRMESEMIYDRANELRVKGDFKAALSSYDECLRTYSFHVAALTDRANVKFALGDPHGALADYTQAIAIKPTGSAYNGRGFVRQYLKQYKEAMEDYDKAIELRPDYVPPYYNRALLKAVLERFADAEKDFSIVIRLDPKMGRAYINRAAMRDRANDLAGAIADLLVATKLEPENWHVWMNLGICQAKAGSRDQATRAFAEALRLCPEASRSVVEGHRRQSLGE